MDTAPLEFQIRRFIIDNFLFGDDEDFFSNASLVEAGVMDSLGVMEVISYIEDTFNITVPDEELLPENLDTIQNIANFVIKKLAA